jgi:hypothetical protein
MTADAASDPPRRNYEPTLGADRLYSHEDGAAMSALPEEGRLSSQAARAVSRLQVLQAQIQREGGMSLLRGEREYYVYN